MKYKSLLALLTLFLATTFGMAQEQVANFTWEKYGQLPNDPQLGKQPGLAGHFSGTHKNVLIIGGGANFPDAGPDKGGKKKYYSTVYLLQKSNGSYKWLPEQDLGYEMGYGAYFSTDKGLVVAGGSNSEGALKKVSLLTVKDAQLVVEELPQLPVSISNCAFGQIGSTIIVSGGKQDGKISNATWALDLSKAGNASFAWEEKAEFPQLGRVMPASAVQNSGDEDRLYVIGGFNNDAALDRPEVYTDAYSYSLKNNEWIFEEEISIGEELYGGNGASAVPFGAHHIVMVGGADKDVFQAAIDREKLMAMAQKAGDEEAVNSYKADAVNYLSQPESFYNFNPEVRAFHTVTKSWTSLGDYPFAAPAVASMIDWDGKLWIINGERKPGVRNPEIYTANYLKEANFGWINTTVLVLYLISMLGLGFYFMRRSRTADNFFKGGGRIPWWAAGISIFATSLSAITFMAVPAKTYTTNWLYFPMAWSIFMIAPVIIKWYLPFFRKLKVTSAYQYLELRFNLASRLMASLFFVFFMIARIAIVLYLPSLALSTVTGIDIYVCIGLMSVITIIYCTMGGVEAVIWGDVIQGFILVFGAILSLIYLIYHSGGIGEMINLGDQYEKFKTFDFAFDLTQPTFWVILFGGGLANSLISYSSDQTLIQRYMTTPSSKEAKKSIWLNGILSIPVLFIFYLIGSGLFTFYKKNPEKLEIGMQNADGIFPFFIVDELPVGLAGLLIAAIFAATMSTLSSNINSVATAITTDFFKRFNPSMDDRQQVKSAQISGALAGLVGAGIAVMLVSMNIKSFFDEFNTVIGLLSSGLGGLFAMGIFMPRVNGKGAISGLVGSTALLLYLRDYSDVSFMLYGLIGLISCMLIGYVVSILLPEERSSLAGLTWSTRSQSREEKKESSLQL